MYTLRLTYFFIHYLLILFLFKLILIFYFIYLFGSIYFVLPPDSIFSLPGNFMLFIAWGGIPQNAKFTMLNIKQLILGFIVFDSAYQ